jgi:voltage-gated potassium channel
MLWWAVTTITTVGYGDRFPMSSAGRAVAVVLMIAGIAMFGVITATIAAYFVEQKAEEDVASRRDQIMERLDRIEAGMRPGEDQANSSVLRIALSRSESWPGWC